MMNHWTYHLEKWYQETYRMPSHFNLIFNQPVIIQNAWKNCKESEWIFPNTRTHELSCISRNFTRFINLTCLFALGPWHRKNQMLLFPSSIKLFQAYNRVLTATSGPLEESPSSCLDVLLHLQTSIRQPQACSQQLQFNTWLEKGRIPSE